MADPEIDAMSAVATALGDLGDDARGRVLRWAGERFGVVLAAPAPAPADQHTEVAPAAEAQMGTDDVTENEVLEESPRFEHFAELFAAANPRTNEDKALVAAYWVQVEQGTEQWASRLLNIELKHLGHNIANITDALTSNMKKKPQRVIQLRKSGSSPQSTKTYKVTHEGIIYVQGMLSGAGA